MSKIIFGNIQGIKDFILSQLLEIYDMKIDKDKIINQEIIDIISKISNDINREINVSIDRSGNVKTISIGDNSSVSLGDIEIFEKKLSGIRVIHTHPAGNPHLSDIDISALLNLKLDAIVSIGIKDNKITGYEVANCTFNENILSYEKIFLKNLENYNFLEKILDTEFNLKKQSNLKIIKNENERAIVVGISNLELLEELKELALACEINVVGEFLQNRSKIDNVFFIGSGKVRELALKKQLLNADLIIFDDELSGLQIRNLEENLGCRVIDRTTLILEIFSRRAKTREAKIQIEMAKLKYLGDRLIGYGLDLSRIGGGGLTRGAGETKLELDRRRIKDNIANLKKELIEIQKQRKLQRNKRENSNMTSVALVGYTNVGKSTIRNLLVDLYSKDKTKKEGVFAENMLFATLDTTTRVITLPDKREISLTDTVGFIRKLSHDLVESFKSTLEEVIFADIILHVIDASSSTVLEKIDAVFDILKELKCESKKIILVLNKIDAATEEQIATIEKNYKNYSIVKISAKNQLNIDNLIEEIGNNIDDGSMEAEFLVPYTRQDVVSNLHTRAIILAEIYEENGTKLKTIVKKREFNLYKDFLTAGE